MVQLGGLVLIALLGLALVLGGFFERLGLPAQVNGLMFVLFLQPLLFALTAIGRERRAVRKQRRLSPTDGSAAAARAAREVAAKRRIEEGLFRTVSDDDLPYAFDHALGRLAVLADHLAAERARPLDERRTGATDESLDRAGGHLSRARQSLEAGHVDLTEMHLDRLVPIVTHLWRYDAELSRDLLATRRGLFGG